MRDYVEEICQKLQFPSEAQEELCSAWERIEATADALPVWQRWIAAYDRDIQMDYAKALEETQEASALAKVHPYTSGLLLFLCLSKHLEELYRERGISERIFLDSCLDMKWKLFECRKVYGIWGSFVAWWFPGFFQLTRFALGRLQFELVDFPAEYEAAGRKAPAGLKRAVNMHIPSCGKLTREACEASFRQAAAFFDDVFPEGTVAFCCTSWLLFPDHRQMLPANSGIVGFMDWFDIYRSFTVEGDLWRIYDCMDTSNTETLPENTRLQQAYKRMLLEGKAAGCGAGVFYFCKKDGSFFKEIH